MAYRSGDKNIIPERYNYYLPAQSTRLICTTCQHYLSSVNMEIVEYPEGAFFLSTTYLGYGTCLFDNSHVTTNRIYKECKNHL
ncbi:MAG: hypothetical protein ACFFEV_08985, partial [Candidatus Thorarchaeota archaeon]